MRKQHPYCDCSDRIHLRYKTFVQTEGGVGRAYVDPSNEEMQTKVYPAIARVPTPLLLFDLPLLPFAHYDNVFPTDSRDTDFPENRAETNVPNYRRRQ